MRTIVISFAHCKGGVGKSTICYHIISLFLLLNKNIKIGVIDMDTVQQTTYKFFERNVNISLLNTFSDIENIYSLIKTNALNILFIDTPGGDSVDIRKVFALTDILITPLQHSLIDIEALVNIHNHSSIILGPFSSIIRNHIKKTAKWILIHNRLPLVNIDNKYTDLIKRIARFLNASIYELYDRYEYRISFENKKIVSEYVLQNQMINKSQIIAHNDIMKIYSDISFIYNSIIK